MDSEDQYSLQEIERETQSDAVMAVVSIRDWVALLFAALVLAAVVGWAFLGSIPISANGKGLVFNPTSFLNVRSAQDGVIQEISVQSGDSVEAGAVLAKIQGTQGDPFEIVAPQAGTIDGVGAMRGEPVKTNEILFWLQSPSAPQDLQIYAFFSLDLGQLIKPGMKAKMSLNGVSSSRFGMLEGAVKEVLPYPISPSDFYLQQIPSARLREYLIGGTTPSFLVIVQPIPDPKTPSGLKWTSKQGPNRSIQSGMLGSVEIELADVRPISFLIPALGNK